MPASSTSTSTLASPDRDPAATTVPLFDGNAFLGRSGQRQPSAFVDVPGLRAAMSAYDLDQVLVYHAAAVRGDVMAANRRLLAEIEGLPDIHPCWVVLPPTALEMGQPQELVSELLAQGVRAVRCFPRAHGYQVRTRVLGDLLQCLARHRVPLYLDFDVVHWTDLFIDWDGLDQICGAFPELPVVLVRPGLMVDRDLYALLARHPNLYIETSYYFVHQGLRALAARFGAGRMVFGTGMPAFAPGPAIATLAYSGLSREEQELVGAGNLQRLLEGVRR
jgi:predicted TIM-barrel fold metal-dependent hydrolase